jgi:hypothetical protein
MSLISTGDGPKGKQEMWILCFVVFLVRDKTFELIYAVRVQTLLQVEKMTANSVNPDQNARMRRLVWIHDGRKCTMLVLSWCGSFIDDKNVRRLSIVKTLN